MSYIDYGGLYCNFLRLTGAQQDTLNRAINIQCILITAIIYNERYINFTDHIFY